MEIRLGTIVKAIAGKEKGGYFAVIGEMDGMALISDGDMRKLQSPKKKSLKHLKLTNTVIDLTEITNKQLRGVLKSFQNQP